MGLSFFLNCSIFCERFGFLLIIPIPKHECFELSTKISSLRILKLLVFQLGIWDRCIKIEIQIVVFFLIESIQISPGLN